MKWRGAIWRKNVLGIFQRHRGPGRRRLNRGHRMLGKQRWDGPVQTHVGSCAGVEMIWFRCGAKPRPSATAAVGIRRQGPTPNAKLRQARKNQLNSICVRTHDQLVQVVRTARCAGQAKHMMPLARLRQPRLPQRAGGPRAAFAGSTHGPGTSRVCWAAALSH